MKFAVALIFAVALKATDVRSNNLESIINTTIFFLGLHCISN
jgi:hypothetical protein